MGIAKAEFPDRLPYIQTQNRLSTSLTMPIFICYQEGGGTIWSIRRHTKKRQPFFQLPKYTNIFFLMQRKN